MLRDELHQMARAAVEDAKGEYAEAVDRLDSAMVRKNSAPLERQLTMMWRAFALKAAISEAFQALHSEGKYLPKTPPPPRGRRNPPEGNNHSSTSSQAMISDQGERPTQPRSHATPPRFEERAETMRLSMLDIIQIYGVPLRDALVGQALKWTDENEMRVRFVRRIIPDYAQETDKVSTYVTDFEAEKVWNDLNNTKDNYAA